MSDCESIKIEVNFFLIFSSTMRLLVVSSSVVALLSASEENWVLGIPFIVLLRVRLCVDDCAGNTELSTRPGDTLLVAGEYRRMEDDGAREEEEEVSE